MKDAASRGLVVPGDATQEFTDEELGDRQHFSARDQSHDTVPCEMADVMALLPPLPRPDYEVQLPERFRGCALVLGLTIIFVSATTTLVQVSALSPTFTWTCCTLIWSEALVALICLLKIQFGDAGELKRSKETCLPVPAEVRGAILAGQTHTLLTNIDGEDGRTYCVRCFLWRPASSRNFSNHNHIHHCRTCQRCVAKFDHHCGVLGRCIAGSCMSGNMGCFRALIFTGQLGLWTFVVSCSIAIIIRWGWSAWGIGLGATIGLFCCVGPCTYLINWSFTVHFRNCHHTQTSSSRIDLPASRGRADVLSPDALRAETPVLVER